MRGQFGGVDPFDSGAIQGLRFARDEAASVEFQVHGLRGVGVREFGDERANGHFDAQFLAEFAHERLLKGFAKLTFAAGEFPQPAKVRIRAASGDKKFSGAEDETGADFDAVAHRPMLL